MWIDFAIVLLLVCINVLSTLVVLLRKTSGKNASGVMLFSILFFNIGLTLWQVLLFISRWWVDNLLLHKLIFVFGTWAVLGTLGFSLAYPDKKVSKVSYAIYSTGILITTIFTFLILSTSLVVRDYTILDETVHFGSLGVVYFSFIIGETLLLLTSFIKRYRKESQLRSYFRYVLLSFSIFSCTLFVLNFILPLLGVTTFSGVGSLFSVIPQVAIVYTLVVKRLHKIQFIIEQLLTGLLTALTPYVAFYLTTWICISVWGSVFASEAYVFSVFVSIIFATINNRIYVVVTDFVHTFITNGVNFDEALEFFESSSLTELNITRLANIYTDTISKVFVNMSTRLCLKNASGSKNFIINELSPLGKNVVFIQTLLCDSYFDNFEIIVSDELDLSDNNEASLKSILLESGIRLLTIFRLRGEVLGFGIISLQKDKDEASVEPFTVEDVDFSERLTRKFLVALDRSLLYDRVSSFNKKLQDEVRDATADLEKVNKELRELDRAKDDLISIASHELRTPATIVKGKLHMLKDRVAKLKMCEAYDPKIDNDIEVCLSAIEREIEQVNTLLEASRIGKDTMILDKQLFDISEVAENTVNDFVEIAKTKGLDLTFTETTKDFPFVNIDVRRIREVFENLITNAIKYTDEGSIEVHVFQKNAKSVCVSVKDTGIGVPKEKIGRLFTKFYRVRNDQENRSQLVKPGGTGLGLFVAKNIVEKHGGEIWLESEDGKGSTFTFCLPVTRKK